jgi:DNA polymerase (family 10)
VDDRSDNRAVPVPTIDNRAIAQLLAEIADLLEIKGENVFKIRAHRSAAETIGGWADPVASMNDAQLRAIPGVGKDIAAKIREYVDTGSCAYHQELSTEFPPSMLGLLRVPGLGPKTVALLYTALNIRSVDELNTAAKAGKLRTLKGMGAKKEAQIIKTLEERAQFAGRHLLARSAAMAVEVIERLRQQSSAEVIAVGALRRGCELVTEIDILAVGSEAPLITHPPANYTLNLHHAPPEHRGAAMQHLTGSTAHIQALRELAGRRGFTLNERGLFRARDGVKVAGETEEAIYDALGLPYIEPELRENRGEIDAAERRALPRLITRADIAGDLHMHTTATDGRDDLPTMAAAARRLGYRYIAITEHSKALAMANGMDEKRLLAHAARVRALNGRIEGLTLLAGVECDILADGTLDLADDCLAELDLVIASVHSQFTQEPAQVTERILKALDNPWVDILGHPTARRMLKREPIGFDVETIVSAAARHGVAMEINCQIERLDLNDVNARLARERGVRLVINTDAHSTTELHNIVWGLQVARRAWTQAGDVLNTLEVDELRRSLRRNRNR